MSLPRVMIAAPASSSGKTLVTCGVLQALVNRGLRVASFKCGPDYIDPMFHSRVIGTRSKNLDTFFVRDDTLRYLFGRTAETCDVSVVEGVMGFYDGMTALGTEASSHDVSRKLNIPVILLLNCRGASLSVLPVLKGFLEFTENNIKGAIFNNMSTRTFELIAPEARKMGVEPIGYVPRVTDLVLESRHLGLVLPSEIDELKDKLNRLADVIEGSLDLNLLLRIAGEAPNLEYSPPKVRRVEGVRIGLADDETFCFTYEDNVELLERCGAEIVRFSPMADAKLPDADGIVLSGGYPELHVSELESNATMLEDIRQKASEGVPIIAECGGFMYLHDEIEDLDGKMHRMCGVIPGSVRNSGKLARFGYATLTPLRNDGVTRGELIVKGHEFHCWDSDNCGSDWRAVKTGGREYTCMHDTGRMLAGFPHLYYYSNPEFASRFLERCREYRESKD